MLVSLGRRSTPEALVGLLLECHERIRRFSRIAQQVATRDDVPEAEIVDACARCERYFSEALPLHVADEEQSLLPRMHGRQPDVDEALATMRAQHRAHDATLDALRDALQAVRRAPADRGHRAQLATAAARAIEDFDAHLALEERVIFPAIDALLDPETQARIIDELRHRRRS